MKSRKERKRSHKLELHRETLRRLDTEKLGWIRGGSYSFNTDCTDSECEDVVCPFTAQDTCVAPKTTAV